MTVEEDPRPSSQHRQTSARAQKSATVRCRARRFQPMCACVLTCVLVQMMQQCAASRPLSRGSNEWLASTHELTGEKERTGRSRVA